MRGWYFVGVMCVASLTANAELATISRSKVKVWGNGCPENTYSITLSPDNTDISVIFDRYAASVSPPRQLFDYKSCQIRVPVQVEPGYRLKVKADDYRGYVSLASKKTRAFFLSQVFIKNGFRFSVTPVQFEYFTGPINEDTLFSKVGRDFSSGCSSSYELTFNSWLFLTAFWKDSSDSLFIIDSFDFSLDSEQVEISRCQ